MKSPNRKAFCAKPETCEGIYFASQIELRTYKALRLYFAKEDIQVHYPIPIFPSTKRFKALGWNIDFYLPTINLYVESKGHVRSRDNQSFLVKCHALERVSPAIIDNLIVVSDQPGQPLWGDKCTVGIETMKKVVRLWMTEAAK